MTARGVATAMRDAAKVAVPHGAQVTWADLGCPKEVGVYPIGEGKRMVEVRVRMIHILAAEDNPDALFTVVVHHPPIGPALFSLGHRID
jgi:hypothetical protein